MGNNDWRPVNNSKDGSTKKFWDQVEPEIKTILGDEEGNFVNGVVKEFRGFKYTSKVYGDKQMVFKSEIKQTKTVTSDIAETNKADPGEETTNSPPGEDDSPSEEKVFIKPDPPREIPPKGNIEEIKMLNSKEFGQISTLSSVGFVPFGNNFNETYRDGFFCMIKYRPVQQ